jgi:hypothetical protein
MCLYQILDSLFHSKPMMMKRAAVPCILVTAGMQIFQKREVSAARFEISRRAGEAKVPSRQM